MILYWSIIVTIFPHVLGGYIGRSIEESQEWVKNPSNTDYKNILRTISNINLEDDVTQEIVSNQNDDAINFNGNKLFILSTKELDNGDKNVLLNLYKKEDPNINKDIRRFDDGEPKFEPETDRHRSTSDEVTYEEDDLSEDDINDTNENDHKKNLDYHDVDLTRGEKNMDSEKAILRASSGKNRTRVKLTKGMKQHRKRAVVLYNFMLTHADSTRYFYEEMHRILQQRAVKDDLRIMITYLEKPENVAIKNKVIQCYIKARREKPRHGDPYALPTNNLVIHYVRDPENDNVP